MANDKYVKLIKQYSEDGGNTWYDSNPPEYKRGDLIETDSPDCGAAVLQYRWFAKGEDYYTCEGYNKYYKEWYQYSYNGEDWFDVFPEQTRNGSLIEQNSIDCDYGVEWIPVEDEYICSEKIDPDPSDTCSFTYELEDIGSDSYYYITSPQSKVYTKTGTNVSYPCDKTIHIEGCKYLEIKSEKPYGLQFNSTTKSNTKPTVILPTPKFDDYGVVYLSLFDSSYAEYNSIDINLDSIINCPNTVYSSPDIDGRVYKMGGYSFDIHGIILDDNMIDHMLYDRHCRYGMTYGYSTFNYYNFRDRVIRINGFDYKLSRTGTEDFITYPQDLKIHSLYPYGNPSFEKRVELTNFKIANHYHIRISDADYVLIDGIEHTTTVEGAYNEVICGITAKKEITLKNITIDEYNTGYTGEGVSNGFSISYYSYKDHNEEITEPTETIVNLENVSLPSAYSGRWGNDILVSGRKEHHFKVHMTNCNEVVEKMMENSVKNGYVELV